MRSEISASELLISKGVISLMARAPLALVGWVRPADDRRWNARRPYPRGTEFGGLATIRKSAAKKRLHLGHRAEYRSPGTRTVKTNFEERHGALVSFERRRVATLYGGSACDVAPRRRWSFSPGLPGAVTVAVTVGGEKGSRECRLTNFLSILYLFIVYLSTLYLSILYLSITVPKPQRMHLIDRGIF